MTPSLPCALFDLCIVPAHDRVRERNNILQSSGALNRIKPSTQRESKLALVLLGGPSKHHMWDNDTMLAQLQTLINARNSYQWIIASSPRTPALTVQALGTLNDAQIIRHEDTSRDWLPGMLARASVVWVSEDSVSMAYEALSSGAQTGLLQVKARRDSRVVASVRMLRDSGRIVDTSRWLNGLPDESDAEKSTHAPLQEADRCAQNILQRWPDLD
jgi:hypothetical protein